MKIFCHKCLKELVPIRTRKIYYKSIHQTAQRYYFWCDTCNTEATYQYFI